LRMHLWRRIRGSKLAAGSKGFSSIAGAIFMVFIIGVLASSYFLWTLSQNTIYNEAIRERNQLDVDRMSESVKVWSTAYGVDATNTVNVSAQIQNVGPSPIGFTTIWIRVANNTWNNYNFSKLSNADVAGGAIFLLNLNIRVSGVTVNSSASYTFASWLITAKGNTVALQQTTVSSNIIISQTTQGIGALMMDFQNFTYYNVTGSKPPYSLGGYPAGASGYYVQGAYGSGGQIAFRVIITDLDQAKRDITLSANSVLFAIFPTQGTQPRGAYWYIVNVNETTGAILGTYTNVTLVYNVAKTLYFASQWPSPDSRFPYPWGSSYTGIAAVNLALVGTIGSDPFGQNIPFVSINVVS